MRFRRVYRDTPEPRTPRAQDTALFHGAKLEIERLTEENRLLKEAVQFHAAQEARWLTELREARLALVSHDFDQAPR